MAREAATSKQSRAQQQQPHGVVIAGNLFALAIVAAALLCLPVASAAGPPNPLPCVCTDVDVRTSFISVVNYTCWQQYEFGKCNESFIMKSIKEVGEGYCQISCGRCPCCQTLAGAAEAAGLTEFVWAMSLTTDRVTSLAAPGFMATLMAPDNNAMKSLFDKLGGKQRIDNDAGLKSKLADIMSYHVVRPLPGYEAYTSPFLTAGTQLQTHRNGSTLSIVGGGDGGRIKVQGSGSSAEIMEKDIFACKGYINKLNWYLLPPGANLS